VWRALASLPSDHLKKPVYLISSDTFVESPAVEQHLAKSLELIRVAARDACLPLEVYKVGPLVDDSFWVNLIGRGYPAPYSSFRWCTDRMKIQPATAFVRRKVAEYGEVIILLGARKSESATRAQVMSHRREVGDRLFRHSSLPNAWVFTPIEDWSTQDIWTYLTSVSSPWGTDNLELVTMYRNAQAGECPLVIDKSTPACGGGRFGCWVCTVVDRDRTMEAMIDNGEVSLQPLLDFRNWLAATRDPNRKAAIRETRRRTGRIEFFGPDTDRKLRHGPFKLDFRKEILERLLTTQRAVREKGSDPEVRLIREDELHKIRQVWLHEEGDWEDSLPAIYERVMEERLDWLDDDLSGMGGAEKAVLDDVTRESKVPAGLLVELMDVEREYHGMSRRAGVYEQLNRVLKKDWRSLEEAWAGQQAANGTLLSPEEKARAH
jgi:DNA sulfur modification protein DndC